MRRTTVEIVKMRIIDLKVGDVVNTNPEALRGWFLVADIRPLTHGGFQISDTREKNSLHGEDNDIVGVQIESSFEQATTQTAASAPVASPAATPAPATAPAAAAAAPVSAPSANPQSPTIAA